MSSNSDFYGQPRWTSLSAAILITVLSFGLIVHSLMAAPSSRVPLTRPLLQSLYEQHKITADQYKQLGADLDHVSLAKRNLEAFKLSLTADQQKLPANQAKEKTLQQQLAAAQDKLSADQAKYMPKINSGQTREDDESPKESRGR